MHETILTQLDSTVIPAADKMPLHELVPTVAPWEVPEALALKGVPQPEKHHPEIDTFEHVCMAWDMARKLAPADPGVWLAVALHDLGKGLTPADRLPSHPGHEEAGAPMVASVCNRLSIDLETTKLCLMVCRYHTHVHRVEDMTVKGIRRFLKNANAHEEPELFGRMLVACEADARGRKGLEDRPYPQPEILIAAAEEFAAYLRAESIRARVKGAAELDIEREHMTPDEWRAIRKAELDLASTVHAIRERVRRI